LSGSLLLQRQIISYNIYFCTLDPEQMKKLVIISLFLVPYLAFSQATKYDLAWEQNDTMIFFSQAVYGDDQQLLPHFSKNFQWPHEGLLPVAKISINKSSIVDSSYLHQLENTDLQSAPSLEYSIVFEKKRPVLQFSVTPFYIDESSGEIRKVESFDIDFQAERPMSTLKSTKAGAYATSSKLASKNWYKIAIEESGIHKLSYGQLESMGISNPASVKVFGAGAVLLPEDFTRGYYDDLSEVPIYMDKGSDQLFNPGDFILFYAHGPVSWNYDMNDDFFSQTVHNYSDRGYYFLTSDLGVSSTPIDVEISTAPTSAVVTTYDLLDFTEEKQYNLLNSGKEWYGDNFSITLNGAYPFTLDGLNTADPVKIRVTAAARSNEVSSFKVKANNSDMGTLTFGTVNLSVYTSTYAREVAETFNYAASSEVVTISLEYIQPNSNSEGWLNHITLNGRAHLNMESSQLIFRDRWSAVFGTDSEFRVGNVSSDTRIWDVTNPGHPGNVPFQNSSGTAVFKISTDSLREFVAFNVNGLFPAPIYEGPGLGKIENQNLHGEVPAEMIVIYDELLEEQVMRFIEHRTTHDGLTISSVKQDDIFNEFSSGTPDISAIRNYLKMHYDRTTAEEMPRYLLLFGDGTYDNKDTAAYNPNLIMTYQSANSLEPIRSFVSDDFYGMLDSGEEITSGLLDIGIGRFPVSSPEEAELLVDKIIAYDQPETLGEWRNYICFIGDDEDGNTHMKQANSLADLIEEEHPNYNVNKILLDAYPQETTPTGDLYPAVTKAINDQMNRGALIINYTGHGGVTGLAHEKILDINNIKAWGNAGKLPLFMTATCEFSRYDEYNHLTKLEATSAGEEVLLNPEGGSIALFTTTRLVYSAQNHRLNEKFYEIVFDRDSVTKECYRLGDIIAYSKNNVAPGINKRNFTLLGDPSLSLAFPKNVIVTDSINNMAVESVIDTVSALDFVTVSGHVETQSGDPYNSFNGTIYPVVYDKMKNLVTLANDGGNAMEFQSRSTILYKGKSTVENGRFSFGFYVPKDINYAIGSGKISYYAENGSDDGHGSTKSLQIGGLGDLTVSDTAGPDIRVFMNDSLFKGGGIVTSSPELLIYVDDQFGINTTGNGIGHDITATLDADRINAIILNEYYQADIDQYASGSVRYPYKDLDMGRHEITVKVWDIFNNSKEKTLEFIVVESTEMLLSEIYNYPNPFIDQTWFNIEHNRPNQQLEVVIKIYNLNGTLASILSDIIYTPGYRLDPIPWDGRSRGGASLGGGLYVYKVYIKSESGEEAVGSGRLIIKR
jgi:hypothetical protein